MNAYDQKHFQLLGQISAGQWRAIAEFDAQALNVLLVCKYIAIDKDAAGLDRLVLTPEGASYQERLNLRSAMLPTADIQARGASALSTGTA